MNCASFKRPLTSRIIARRITEIMFTKIFLCVGNRKRKILFIACLERKTFPRYESNQNATNVRQPAGVINHDLWRVIPLNALLSFFPAMDCRLVLVREFYDLIFMIILRALDDF
jgi:hypothetical protein